MKKRFLTVLVSFAMSVVGVAIPSAVATAATTWNNGDVFAAVSNGSYKVYDNNGVFKQTISDGRGGFTTGCAFNPTGTRLYTTNFSQNLVEAYDNNDPHAILQTINTTGSGTASNESVVFAADGSFYVGHAGGNHKLTHYDAAGNSLMEYSPAIERIGTDWVDLSSDQQTIFYTSEGAHVKRFDVATNTQLTDFNPTALTGGSAFALRLLPPGNSTGGLLVADLSNIVRLNGAGAVMQTYGVSGEGSWFALNLDPNGTSFWSGNISTGNFYRFNINTGTKELGPINAAGGDQLFGLCLKGELTAAVSNITLTPATATNPTGTNHTVTAKVTTNGQPAPGVLVSFSITAGPDTAVGGTCSTDLTCHTDTNGQVSFTYTNNGSPGPDTIQACFTDTAGVKQCATATKIWIVVEPKITATGIDVSATEGTAFVNKPVATIKDPDLNSTAAEYTASIDWGDGTPTSPGTVTGPKGGPFTVSGDHTYPEEGSKTIKVTINDPDTPSNGATTMSTATIADAALSAKCAIASPFIPQTYTGPTATFSDASSTGTLSDFSATINWGDGNTSPADGNPVTIAGGPGNAPYTVSGTHTYSSTGPVTVTTSISDVGKSTAKATCAETVFAFATSKGAAFVVGDLTVPPANLSLNAYFWGSQWDQMNPMSGLGPSPSAMKGFAGFEDNFLGLPPPVCGGSWSTDTGNSTPPPPGPLPAFMGLIVSSNVTQNGSVITGDIKDVVIVRTNPGYAPNPGSPGTGTIVGFLCIS
jgi:hypothetical protein